MIALKRFLHNPILAPVEKSAWEAVATFNPSVIKNDVYHMVYRAISKKVTYYGNEIQMSSIGYAKSLDGIEFTDRRQLIAPENQWEQFGCEDPRVTKVDDRYYIFYTALSDYPHTANGIKSAVAVTRDFETIDESYLVTPFNAKAMALFPEKVNGKYAVILSVNTDNPPSDIAICYLDSLGDLKSEEFWWKWYEDRKKYALDLERREQDHVEVGAVPVKTEKGWLLIYSYIKNYFKQPAKFGVEAVLLDNNDPTHVLARSEKSMLSPVEEYELYGLVNNIVFPTSAIFVGDNLRVYYGAADTVSCIAEVAMTDLMKGFDIRPRKITKQLELTRYEGNPVITPNPDHEWEAQSTFNPTAVAISNKVHILYRALSRDNTSTVGYAVSEDGFEITERANKPIYTPTQEFEMKAEPGAYSGCEDARITCMEEEGKLYMCYTAYSGVGTTGIALTSIGVDDFEREQWNWSKPMMITDKSRDDKNGCIFPEKIEGKYAFFHRIGGCIWLDLVDDLEFENEFLGGKMILCAKKHSWYSRKVGIAGPPIKTEKGWVLIFHALSKEDDSYRLGAMLLDLKHPDRIVKMLDYPLIEPKEGYEKAGLRHQTVFSCGGVVKDGELIIYYGGADKVVGVASMNFGSLLDELCQ